jgi:hypothetical protein
MHGLLSGIFLRVLRAEFVLVICYVNVTYLHPVFPAFFNHTDVFEHYETASCI